MSKSYKVRNGLKYQPIKQTDQYGRTTATRIEVSYTTEPDSNTGEVKLRKRDRLKAFMEKLGRGAAYAMSR